MTLYEINAQILECFDAETGEILDSGKLDKLEMDKATKMENLALFIKNLTAEAKALDEEAYALIQRQKACERKIDSLKAWYVTNCGNEPFKTARCVVSFRKSESVNIVDEAAIPEEFVKVTVTKAPMKVAIKEALKNGTAVPGAEIKTNYSMSVK